MKHSLNTFLLLIGICCFAFQGCQKDDLTTDQSFSNASIEVHAHKTTHYEKYSITSESETYHIQKNELINLSFQYNDEYKQYDIAELYLITHSDGTQKSFLKVKDEIVLDLDTEVVIKTKEMYYNTRRAVYVPPCMLKYIEVYNTTYQRLIRSNISCDFCAHAEASSAYRECEDLSM